MNEWKPPITRAPHEIDSSLRGPDGRSPRRHRLEPVSRGDSGLLDFSLGPSRRIPPGERNLPRRSGTHRLDQPCPSHCVGWPGQERHLAPTGRVPHGLGGKWKGECVPYRRVHSMEAERFRSAGRTVQDPVHPRVSHLAGRRRDRRSLHGRRFDRAQARHRDHGRLRLLDGGDRRARRLQWGEHQRHRQ